MKSDLLKIKRQNLVYSLKSNNPTLIGIYIGIWCGDGTQYYDNGYRIKICCDNRDIEMIQFFKFILSQLFGKTVSHISRDRGHKAFLRFNSKFIYDFVFNYIKYDKNKTYTVCLIHNIDDYSKDFIDGFILGLTLSDGYTKDRFHFNVTSSYLAKNALDILKIKGFNPTYYIHDRNKYGWKDLHMVSLSKKQNKKLVDLFDSILIKLNYPTDFQTLKYNH